MRTNYGRLNYFQETLCDTARASDVDKKVEWDCARCTTVVGEQDASFGGSDRARGRAPNKGALSGGPECEKSPQTIGEIYTENNLRGVKIKIASITSKSPQSSFPLHFSSLTFQNFLDCNGCMH